MKTITGMFRVLLAATTRTFDSFLGGSKGLKGKQMKATTILALLALLVLRCAPSLATETVTYYYTNPQGTPLATADAAGNILSASDYRPYGVQTLGTAEPGPGYTGHINDPGAGLVYMQARYYDPHGRMLSPDPTGIKPGDIFTFNRFVYSNNNPVTNVDPDGRVCMTNKGFTRCVTSVYDVTFRALSGFHDFSSSSPNYHFYSTPVVTNEVTLAEARAGLVNKPTPGFSHGASPEGIKNDATPLVGGMFPGVYFSPVVSFTATNLVDNQQVVVNVTLDAHKLSPGIVVREAVPASGGGVLIQSWGEGTSRLQSKGSPLAAPINGIWNSNAPAKPAHATGCTGEGWSTGCLL